jgi:DnaK suppressor protein
MALEDEYLNEEQLKTLKSVLDEQLETLMNHSRKAVSELVEVREAETDPLDLAVSESNRDFTLRLADRERRLLGKIRYVLKRMQAGEYGVCESCGEEITIGRLMARPVATLCIDCKTEAEQVERRERVF